MQVDFSSIEDHVAEGVELNKRVSVYNQRSLELVRLLSAILEAKTSSDPDWQRVPATAQKGRPAQRTSPGNFSRSHLYALSKKPHPESITHMKNDVIRFSASGFRDFTRIAASDPTMWRDVFLNNDEAVLEMMQRFSEDLTYLQRAIRWQEGDKLFDLFSRTRDIRRSIIDAGQD